MPESNLIRQRSPGQAKIHVLALTLDKTHTGIGRGRGKPKTEEPGRAGAKLPCEPVRPTTHWLAGSRGLTDAIRNTQAQRGEDAPASNGEAKLIRPVPLLPLPTGVITVAIAAAVANAVASFSACARSDSARSRLARVATAPARATSRAQFSVRVDGRVRPRTPSDPHGVWGMGHGVHAPSMRWGALRGHW